MIYPGTKYKSNQDIKMAGTIHFAMAYSAGFHFVLPKGEIFKVSCFTDPNDEHVQVWLDNSGKFEHQIVGGYLNSEKYSSYSLILTKEQLESACDSLVDFSDALYFYSSKEKHGEFSNFADFGFKFQDKFYPTVEHFYQSQKFSDPEYSEKIRLAPSPKNASDLGKDRNHKMKDTWDEIKNDIMFLGVKLKFENNHDLLESLLATEDRLLIENSPYDKYWGIGQDGSGYNHLGNILMRVREILKAPL